MSPTPLGSPYTLMPYNISGWLSVSHSSPHQLFGRVDAWHKAQPHSAMLHSHGGRFLCPCDAVKSHAGNFAPDFLISQLFIIRF